VHVVALIVDKPQPRHPWSTVAPRPRR
jgi:hypothetical protein